MCAGVGAAIVCRWPVAGLRPPRRVLPSAVRAARILQFPSEPTQTLAHERVHIFALSTLKQLSQGASEEFSGAAIWIGFQLMPVAIVQAQLPMQCPGQFWCGVGPGGAGGGHGGKVAAFYPGGCSVGMEPCLQGDGNRWRGKGC